MRRILGHYRQQPRENLAYKVDYSQWLAAGDLVDTSILEVDSVTNPPLVLSNTYEVSPGVVGFSATGGASGTTYKITVLTTTTTGRSVERELFITVEEL
jgi:hypothetical protein